MSFNLFITGPRHNVLRILRRMVPTERFVPGGSAACLVYRNCSNLYKMSPRWQKPGRCLFASSASSRVCVRVCLWQRTSADEVEANDPPLQMSHKHLQTGRTWDLHKIKNLLLWLKGTCVTVRTALIIINYETDRPTASVFSPIHSQGGVQLPQQVLALVYVATLC